MGDGRVAPLRAKLAIGDVDDPLEKEADVAADRVMRMVDAPARSRPISSPSSSPLAPSQPLTIQRKCAACDDEDTVKRKADGSGSSASALPHVESVVRSPGQPLDGKTRAFMEPRFGHDFSDVRVHADASAADSAKSIGALAYTVSSHIAFGAGRYSPDTASGRRLVAHELAHVVQNDREGVRTARRAVSSNFRITEIDPNDAADPSTIFFESGSSTIAPGSTEEAKIAALATPAARKLTLNGFSSEEGSPAANDASANARIAAVDTALKNAGHTGARAKVNLRTRGIGDINYRHRRSVEVLPTPLGLAAAPSPQNACNVPGAEVAPCGTSLAAALTIAMVTMATANLRLAVPGDAGVTALLGQLFSGVPRATVESRMMALAIQVNQLAANHRCHTSCDPSCGRPAYSDPPAGIVGGTMTLCPDFLSSADDNWRARVLIHESAHGTPGFAADDIAYANTRQISFLSPADQLRNTDSYVLLAWLLAHPPGGGVTIGPATPDTLVGMSAPEESAARRAIAWVESWLNYGDFDTEGMYGVVHRSLPPAAAWASGQTGDDYNRELVHALAPIFGLTDPGAAPPFVLPKVDDKVKIAGIHDRFDQMYKSVNWQTLTVNRGGPRSDAWGSGGATLPRLTQSVTLGPAFFGKGAVDQVKHLVRLMADAMFGISAPFASKYPSALDKIRKKRVLGP